jgi:cell division protein FtsB
MKKEKASSIGKRQLISGILMAVLLYFIFHAIYGNRGIVAYFKLNQSVTNAEKELDELRAERLEIEHKVKSLKSESLDRDMLDEQARKGLGVAGEKEQAFIPEKLLEEKTEPVE